MGGNNILLKKFLIVLISIVVSCGLIFAYYYCNKKSEDISLKPSKNTVGTSTNITSSKNKDAIEIKLSAVGDILVHESQLLSQYNPDTKQYDFTNNFKFVKPYIESSDIAIANLETTLAGEKNKYTGYPTFNTPDEIVDALKGTGFDILSAANNHILDRGSEGVLRTPEVVKSKGLDLIGIRKTAEDIPFVIKNVKEIKVGFTNYAFETQRNNGSKTLNSLIMPKEVEPLIDTFNYDYLNEDLLKMKERINQMKASGAEVIVFSMHWGTEYQRQPNDYQKKIAKALADYGVDIILGTHPHVLEPIDYIESNISNKKTLVVYSMGNFISNQCFERLNNRFPEDGTIVNITLKKDLKKNIITIEDVNYIPTWVHREPNGTNFIYEILPLTDALKDKSKYNLTSKDSIWRAENSYNATTSLIRDSNSQFVVAPSFEEAITTSK